MSLSERRGADSRKSSLLRLSIPANSLHRMKKSNCSAQASSCVPRHLSLLLPTVGFHVTDLVTVENTSCPCSDSTTWTHSCPCHPCPSFSPYRPCHYRLCSCRSCPSLTLEHRDVHRHNVILSPGPGNGRHLSSHLIEGVESTRVERQMVP